MKRLLATFAVAALWGGGILAADAYTPSINLNFYAPVVSGNNDNGGELTTTDAVGAEGYAIPGNLWDNMQGKDGTLSTLNLLSADGTKAAISGATVTIAGSCGYYYKSTLTGANDLRNGYIDDKKNSGLITPNVTITNIPFDYYKLVVYFSNDTDGKRFGWITLSGGEAELSLTRDKTDPGTATIAGETYWGKATSSTETPFVEGGNYLVTPVVKNSGSKTLKITGHADSTSSQSYRAGIAAIQIVKVDAEGYAAVTVYDPATGEALAAPTGAKTVSADSSEAESFGNDVSFRQCAGTNIASVVKVTGGTHTDLNGFLKKNETADNAYQDVYLVMSGGSATLVKGVQEMDYQTPATQITYGNAIVQLEGDATANYVFGAGNKGGNYGNSSSKPGTVTGNTGVVVQGNAVVKGSIVGGWSSAHNATPKVTGNTSVLVKNVQGDNTADPLSKYSTGYTLFGAGYVIGGSTYEANTGTSCSEIGGDSSVTVALGEDASGTFAKTIVGASFLPDRVGNDNDTNLKNQKVLGSSSVSITAPNGVTFSGNVIGGGYTGRPKSKSAITVGGNSSVTIDGGTYSGRIVAGGYSRTDSDGNVATDAVKVTGTATLTVKGGVFSAATIDGGNADSRVLKVVGAIDFGQVAGIVNFDSIVLSGDDAALTIPASIDTSAAPWTSISLADQTEQDKGGEWKVKWRTNADETVTAYASFARNGAIIIVR